MKTYTRRALSWILAIALLITCGISGLVLPTMADPTSDVVYSEDFQDADHGWKQGGNAVDAVADGETNKALSLTGSAKTYIGPVFDVNVKAGERYLVRYKLKTLAGTDEAEDGIMTFFYNSTAQDGSPQGTTMNLKAATGHKTSSVTVKKDTYVYVQELFVAAKDATSLHVGLRSSTAGKIDVLVDDVSVIRVDGETEFVPNGDFEEDAEVGMMMEAYSKKGATHITETDGNKALKFTAGGLTYLRLQGAKNGRLYEVKLRYKGAITGASYAAGCKIQVLKKHSTTASDEWRDYHVYVATSNSNIGYVGFYPAEGTLVDDFSVREIFVSLPETEELLVGNSKTLTPVVEPALTTAPTMTWESSDATIATVADGVVTGVAAGQATITLKSAADKALATTTVTVKQGAAATGIALDKTTAEVDVESTVTLTASAIPDDASLPSITWTSSDETVATVANGVVTGVKAGYATITATADGLEPVTCAVTVAPKNLFANGDFEQGASENWGGSTNVAEGYGKDGSIGLRGTRAEGAGDWDGGTGAYYKGALLGQLQPSTKYVLSFDYKNEGAGGGQLYFSKDFGTMQDGTKWNTGYNLPKGDCDWTRMTYIFTTPETISTNKGWELNVRTIGQVGYTYYDNFSLKEYIGAPAATGITLDKATASVDVEGTVELVAGVVPEAAEMPTIVWSSSDNAIATVEDGVVTGVAKGTATITATAGELTATCVVTVNAKNLIVNGDFEQGASVNWGDNSAVKDGVGKDGTIGLESVRAESNGDYTAGGGGYYKGALLGLLTPNTTYVLSFDYKNVGAGQGQLYFMYDFGTTSEGKAWAASTGFNLPSGEVDWTRLTYTFTTPATLSKNKGWELNLRSLGKQGTTYYDNIRLELADTQTPNATGIALDKTAATLDIEGTVTLNVVVTPEGAKMPEITWTSSDETVATVADGVVTALKAGTTTITATAGALTATCEVTVNEDDGNLIKNGDFEQGASVAWGNSSYVKEGVGKDGSWGLESTRAAGNGDWDAGKGSYYKGALLSNMEPSTLYILSFDYKNTGSGRGQIYFSKDFGTRSDGTALNTGINLPAGEGDWRRVEWYFTTPATISANANNEIMFRSLGKEGTSYYDNISLVKAPVAESVTMSNTTAEVLVGKTFTLSLIASPADTTIPAVTWTSSDDTVATVENGVVTGVKAGTVTITAAPAGLTAVTCTVNVVVDDGNLIINGNFEQGAAVNWGSSVYVKEGVGKDGSWGLESVRPAGNGDYTDGKGQYYKNALLENMTPNTLYILSFDYKNTGGGKGQIYFAKKFGTTTDGKELSAQLLLPAGEVDWTHMEYYFTTPATISTNKNFELLFRSVGKEGFTYYDNIKIVPAPMATSVTMSNTSVEIFKDKTFTLSLIASPADTSIPQVEWTTSDASVATVENGVVTGLNEGTATITATPAGLTAVTCQVTVVKDDGNLIINGNFEQGGSVSWNNSATVQQGVGKDGSWGLVSTRPESNGDWDAGPGSYYRDVLLGNMQPNTMYILSFDYKNTGEGRGQVYFMKNFGKTPAGKDFNTAIDLPAGEVDWTHVEWYFTTPATISANAKNEVLFRSRGKQGASYYDNIKLVPAPMAESVTLNATSAQVKEGKTFTLVLTAAPENTTIPTVTWTSSDETVATVENGVVTGLKAGTATITAAPAGLTAVSCEVTIMADDGNLIENGDFEQGSSVAWGNSAYVQAGVGKDGSYGLKLNTTVLEGASKESAASVWYKEPLVALLEPDSIYTLTVDVKHEGKGFGALYTLDTVTLGNLESGKAVSGTFQVASGDKDWFTYTMTFSTPSAPLSTKKGTEIMLRQIQYATYVGDGCTYFDNLKLVKTGTVVHADEIYIAPDELELLPYESGTMKVMTKPVDTATGIITWESSDPSKVTVDQKGNIQALVANGEVTITATNDKGKVATAKVVVREDANIIKNGDFEQGGKYWNDTLNAVAGIGKDGSYGFQLVKKEGSSSTATYYKESFTALTANTTYILTFDYYKTKGSSWRFWTSTLGFGTMVSMKNDAASEWHTKQMIFTTPADYAPNKGWDFAIVVDSDGTYNTAVLDNIVLRKYNSGVAAESITLNKSESTIIPGRTLSLNAFATPENGDLNDMTWTSSDHNVAIVEFGVVTGVGAGVATITGTTKNGKSATCVVTVSGDEVYAKNPTFDIKDDTSWELKDGAELVKGEGSVGTDAIKLPQGASVTQTVRGLRPDTLYQIRVKSKTSASAAKVIVKSGDVVLYEGSTKAVKTGFSNATAEFTTPATLGEETTITIVMEKAGWILVDNVILNVKASLIDFVVNDLFWVGGGYQVVPGTELTFAATVVNQGKDPVKVGQVIDLDICKNGESFMTLSHTVDQQMDTGDSVILVAEQPWAAEAGHWVISGRANSALKILELDDTNNSTQKNLRVDENILTAPAPALDAEMTDLTFSDEFNGRESIDQYATGKDGYKWYVTRPYGKPNTEPDDYEITDGVIRLMAKEGGYNITLSTLDLNTEVGYTWNKGYLEVRFKIVKPDSERYGGPAIWSFPDTKVLEISGQNRKWVEMDWMEYWGITKSRPGGYYTITFHDEYQGYEDEPDHWYNNGNASREGLGDGEWHTMGWLWVENAVIAYMDGEECFRMQLDPNGPPSCKVNVNEGPPDTTGAFTYINEQFNALFIGGHREHPMDVDYVRIWQGGTGSIDLPDINGGDDDNGSTGGGMTVDAFTWWYNYCTDIYGDNITEVTYENFLTVLGAESVDGEYTAQLLWEQLTDQSKAAINEMLTANGQPTFEELLAAALEMAEKVAGGWTPEDDLPSDQPEQGEDEGEGEGEESEDEYTSDSDEEEFTSDSDEEEKPEDNAPTGATTALPIVLAVAVALSAMGLWVSRKKRTNA